MFEIFFWSLVAVIVETSSFLPAGEDQFDQLRVWFVTGQTKLDFSAWITFTFQDLFIATQQCWW